jgi:hypothetical protein
MEQDSHEAELRALRLSAKRGEWNGCVDATEKLLRRLPASRSVMLVWEVIARRLPLFERHQPTTRWPRDFLDSSRGASPSNEEREWPEAEDDFPGPGANSFTSAVEHLWRASCVGQDARPRAEALASAVASVILAEKNESWGSRHPEEWARWYALAATGGDEPSLTDIQLAIMRDPEAVRLARDAWLEVAARLEEALGAGGD